MCRLANYLFTCKESYGPHRFFCKNRRNIHYPAPNRSAGLRTPGRPRAARACISSSCSRPSAPKARQRPDVVPVFEQVGRERVTERVTGRPLRDPRLPHGTLNRRLHRGLVHVMPQLSSVAASRHSRLAGNTHEHAKSVARDGAFRSSEVGNATHPRPRAQSRSCNVRTHASCASIAARALSGNISGPSCQRGGRAASALSSDSTRPGVATGHSSTTRDAGRPSESPGPRDTTTSTRSMPASASIATPAARPQGGSGTREPPARQVRQGAECRDI